MEFSFKSLWPVTSKLWAAVKTFLGSGSWLFLGGRLLLGLMPQSVFSTWVQMRLWVSLGNPNLQVIPHLLCFSLVCWLCKKICILLAHLNAPAFLGAHLFNVWKDLSRCSVYEKGARKIKKWLPLKLKGCITFV